MARGMTASALAQLAAGNCYPVVFVEADFADGTVFLWSGIGSVVWNSITWIGVGTLGGISPITEVTETAAQGLTLSLSGIPSTMLAEALTQCRQGNPVKVWFGFLDGAGNVISTPYQSFKGRMDVPTIQEGVETSTITITAENNLIDLQRSRERRYTQEDQQIDFPTDLGFAYVPSLQQISLTWGKAGNALPIRTGAGSGTGTHPCFTGNAPLRIRRNGEELVLPFVVAKATFRYEEDEAYTRRGWRPIARYLEHEFKGELIAVDDWGVTFEHRLWHADDWHPARIVYCGHECFAFEGQVFNLEIATEVEEERNYQLGNGVFAHNSLKADVA